MSDIRPTNEELFYAYDNKLREMNSEGADPKMSDYSALCRLISKATVGFPVQDSNRFTGDMGDGDTTWDRLASRVGLELMELYKKREFGDGFENLLSQFRFYCPRAAYNGYVKKMRDAGNTPASYEKWLRIKR